MPIDVVKECQGRSSERIWGWSWSFQNPEWSFQFISYMLGLSGWCVVMSSYEQKMASFPTKWSEQRFKIGWGLVRTDQLWCDFQADSLNDGF